MKDNNESTVNNNTLLSEYSGAVSKAESMLDNLCKRIISNKRILAWIMKSCVEEYKECSIEDIEEKYIEGTPDKIKKYEPYIEGSRNEDTSNGEQSVFFDIKFNSLVPRDEHMITLIINVECQSDFYPGYPLLKRAVYYSGRMISSQYGTVFSNSHYEKLRKVYSIWICLNPPRYRRNTINIYSLVENQLVGSVAEKKENYDLITVAMICIGDDEDENCGGVLKLLSVLFSKEKNLAEKMKLIEKEFDIPMTQSMEEEVSQMCNYARYVKLEGIKEGVKEGIKEGVFASLKNLIESTDMNKEQAMTILKIPEQDKKMYEKMLQQTR